MIEGTHTLHQTHPNLVAWATTFDARRFEEPDFAARVIADLNRDFKRGALAVKLWKNIGLAIRSKSGAYLMPDSPALTPILDAIQKSGKTLITHLADPLRAWQPLDGSTDTSYYKTHPEWHLYGRAGVPSKAAVLEARDRLLARRPQLRVIGCHLGSHEESLADLAARLDRYPNFMADTAARVRYLVAADRDATRQFVLKYQDRLIYATDFSLTPDDAKSEETLRSRHDTDWAYFSSSGDVKYGDRTVKGLRLPEKTLRKIFHDNAARTIPGIG